jgi:hypothetical protein
VRGHVSPEPPLPQMLRVDRVKTTGDVILASRGFDPCAPRCLQPTKLGLA